jgi:hypothetical protein
MRIYLLIYTLLLFVMSCHHPRRNNPFDPVLTPAVELLSVTFDPRHGTATLTWSRYNGGQPFQAYQITRRLSTGIVVDRRATIPDIAETTFVDTNVEADHQYVYSVLIINTAGLEVASNSKEVFFSFEPPQVRVVFDSRTASAALSWDRAVSGFVRYDIQRWAEDEKGLLTVHRTTVVDETTFTDTGLNGNTEYRYTVTTRLTTGREVESSSVGGKFHGFLREWTVPPQMTGGIAVDPDDRIYVSSTNPNQISQFTGQGELLRQIPTDSSPTMLAANRHGVYSIVQPGIGSTHFYVNAFDLKGTQRFQWPPATYKEHLRGIAVSSKGDLWVSQFNSRAKTSTLYLLDVITGEPVDTLEVKMPIINGMSLWRSVGVAVIPPVATVGDVVFVSPVATVGFGVFDMATGEVLRVVGHLGGKGTIPFPHRQRIRVRRAIVHRRWTQHSHPGLPGLDVSYRVGTIGKRARDVRIRGTATP